MIKRDLQDWIKHISNGKLLKQGKDPFCFYPIVDGEKILTGSVTTACDSVLQFINKTNSQYNFTPAEINTTDTIILPQNIFQNRTHAHRQSNQQSHSIGIGNATIIHKYTQLYCTILHCHSLVQPELIPTPTTSILLRTIPPTNLPGLEHCLTPALLYLIQHSVCFWGSHFFITNILTYIDIVYCCFNLYFLHFI